MTGRPPGLSSGPVTVPVEIPGCVERVRVEKTEPARVLGSPLHRSLSRPEPATRTPNYGVSRP